MNSNFYRISEETLFYQLGGTAAMRAIIKEFYRRVILDRILLEKLADVDLEWLMQTQVDIFTEATGGPMTNPVQRMRSAFIHLPVSGDYFPKMRILLIETLLNLSIDFPLIDEVVKLLRPIRYSSDRIGLEGSSRNGIEAWQYAAMIDRTQRRMPSSDA